MVAVAAKRVAKGLWWDRAWGLVQGCTKVSPGCAHCWAEREAAVRSGQASEAMQYRFGGVTNNDGKWTGKVRLLTKNLVLPLSEVKPRVWAVWNDLFHADVPDSFIHEAYAIMLAASQHTYIVLTKRADRMGAFWGRRAWPGATVPANVWHLVTAETQDWLRSRERHITRYPAGVRGLSLEPLLGEMDLSWALGRLRFEWTGKVRLEVAVKFAPPMVGWVIVGAESGGQRRPCKIEWVRDIVEQCREAGVPVFVKQLHIDGRLSKDMAEWPEDLRVREFPTTGAADGR